ncbi:hypothetical protein KEM55_006206, partial [Ascosphaera atra]
HFAFSDILISIAKLTWKTKIPKMATAKINAFGLPLSRPAANSTADPDELPEPRAMWCWTQQRYNREVYLETFKTYPGEDFEAKYQEWRAKPKKSVDCVLRERAFNGAAKEAVRQAVAQIAKTPQEAAKKALAKLDELTPKKEALLNDDLQIRQAIAVFKPKGFPPKAKKSKKTKKANKAKDESTKPVNFYGKLYPQSSPSGVMSPLSDIELGVNINAPWNSSERLC